MQEFLADRGSNLGKRCMASLECGKRIGDRFSQLVRVDKLPIGLCRGGKPCGYSHAPLSEMAHHLAERCVFPADKGYIFPP